MRMQHGFLSIRSRRHLRVRLALASFMSIGVMSVGMLGVTAPAQGSSALAPTDLGTLGGRTSIAEGVSGSLVVGWSEVSLAAMHAFAYDLGASSPSMEDLGTLGGTNSQATAASGDVVVGYSDRTAGVQGTEHAFAYDRGAASPVMRDLGTLGGSTSRALAVSGNIVVGTSEMAGQIWQHAFSFDLSATPGTMKDLGTLGGNYSAPRAVSANVVVGYGYTAGGSEDYAFAYDLGGPSPAMQNLGSLGGLESEARGVSGRVVVGFSYLNGDNDRHAFTYNLDAAPKQMLDLGTLGGRSSSAEAISAGNVVGYSNTAAGAQHAFAYDLDAASPGMLDLGSLGGNQSVADHVSGNIVVGGSQTAGGDQRGFAYDLGAPAPSMQELGTLGGSLSRASDVDGTIVVGIARTAGELADHAVAWNLGPAADSAGPQVTIGSPTDGATYTVGDAATASFSCADPSGVAGCTGALNGRAISSGGPLATTVTGTFTLSVSGVDTLGNTTSRSASYTVVALPGGASSAVSGGGTLTTDPSGAGASPAVPVQTAITAPAQVSGVLTVTPRTTTTPPPAGFSLFAAEVVIAGPPASAASPYDVSFTVDSSVLAGIAPADVQVFRNGVPLTGCTDATAAIPDPCVVSRGFAPGGGGDALVRVRTSQFSTWSLGRLRFALTGPFQPVDPAPTVNTAKAGSAIPVKFKLGGDKGLDVLVAGYPKSGAASCGGAATDEIEEMVSSAASALTYDIVSGQYSYKWKTTTAMKGCRDLILKFKDGSSITAAFNLR